MLLICLLMFGYSGASECDVTDKFTWDNVSYSMFFDCSLAYSDAVDECNNTGMQILRLKTTKEMNYFSATVVKLGYINKEVWVSGICPDIATPPNVDNLCAMYSANITDEETRGYVHFTSNCQDSHGWICEDKTDVHPCPSPSTPSGTTLDTLASSHPACDEPLQTKQGVNQYLIFGTCEQPLSAAIAQCSAFNSSLAVLVSSGELQYLADHIGGKRNGSWSFWIGGLMQTGNCVKVVFDQSIIANITQRKVTVSMGHNCHDSQMFVCKTVTGTDLGQDNLVLHERQQGSVMDCRPTAIFLGSVGIAVLVAVVVFIVAIDVPNLVVDVGRAKRNVERFKTRWKRNAQPNDGTKA